MNEAEKVKTEEQNKNTETANIQQGELISCFALLAAALDRISDKLDNVAGWLERIGDNTESL